jgi:hypothetical protein
MVHLRHAFNNTHSYSADVFPLEIGLVLHQGLESLARCEQTADRVVHGKVSETHAQDLVAKVYESKGMVDEEVAAHQLVDEKLFYQKSSAVLREHATRWGLEGVGTEWLEGTGILWLHLFGYNRADGGLLLLEDLRWWNNVRRSLRRSSGTLLICLMVLEN